MDWLLEEVVLGRTLGDLTHLGDDFGGWLGTGFQDELFCLSQGCWVPD